jgi:hypothetical protein
MSDQQQQQQAPTAAEVWKMSPAEATAHLAAMKADYDARNAAPVDATAAKLADPEFRDAYLAGGAAQKSEIANLVAGKVNPSGVAALVDAALAGELSTSGLLHANSKDGVSPQSLLSAIKGFRDVGVSEGALKELLTNKPVDRETFNAVSEFRKSCLRDAEWTKKWLAGDAECRLQAALFAIVRVNGKAA